MSVSMTSLISYTCRICQNRGFEGLALVMFTQQYNADANAAILSKPSNIYIFYMNK